MAEGLLMAILIAAGVIPTSGASAAAAAVFPLDVFFDVKQALAQTSSWPLLVLVVVVALLVRSAVLAATVVLSEGSRKNFLRTWTKALGLVAIAAIALLPSAGLMFVGVAGRYAPFIWVGAVLGLVPGVLLMRRAVLLDAGAGPPEIRGLPELGSFLAYAYLLALLGVAMSSFGDLGRIASPVLVGLSAPIHALVLLGWREHARRGTYPGGGTMAVALTVIVAAVLMVGTVYDRYIRKLPPVARAPLDGELLLLGGVDSTLTTGALADIDVRHFGFAESRSRMLSYRDDGEPTTKADTRGDLDRVAVAISNQIEESDTPVSLLGHSQAALIVDRIVDAGLPGPARSAVLAPPPPFPPPVDIPPPDVVGAGKPGGDVARALATLLRGANLQAYDVDSEAYPTNLEAVVLIDSRVPRLSVWALGDSVWLDRDWRRPGELNVVALTDHVGVVNNGRAVGTVREFIRGTLDEDDEVSWRGAFVGLLRHAFGPWRPATP